MFLDPNSAVTFVAYGSTLYYASGPAKPCRSPEGPPSQPGPPCRILTNIANSHWTLGQYDEAVRFYNRLLKEYPDHFSGNISLTATL